MEEKEPTNSEVLARMIAEHLKETIPVLNECPLDTLEEKVYSVIIDWMHKID